eukprot:EG_transcript_2594
MGEAGWVSSPAAASPAHAGLPAVVSLLRRAAAYRPQSAGAAEFDALECDRLNELLLEDGLELDTSSSCAKLFTAFATQLQVQRHQQAMGRRDVCRHVTHWFAEHRGYQAEVERLLLGGQAAHLELEDTEADVVENNRLLEVAQSEANVDHLPLLITGAVEAFRVELVLMTVSPFERSILVAPALAPPQGRVLLGHYGVANFRPLRRIEPQPERLLIRHHFVSILVDDDWFDAFPAPRPTTVLLPLRRCCAVHAVEEQGGLIRAYLLRQGAAGLPAYAWAHGFVAETLALTLRDALDLHGVLLGACTLRTLQALTQCSDPSAVAPFVRLDRVQWYRHGVVPRQGRRPSLDADQILCIEQPLIETVSVVMTTFVSLQADIYVLRCDFAAGFGPVVCVRDYDSVVLIPGSRIHIAASADGGGRDSVAMQAVLLQQDYVARGFVDRSGFLLLPVRLFADLAFAIHFVQPDLGPRAAECRWEPFEGDLEAAFPGMTIFTDAFEVSDAVFRSCSEETACRPSPSQYLARGLPQLVDECDDLSVDQEAKRARRVSNQEGCRPTAVPRPVEGPSATPNRLHDVGPAVVCVHLLFATVGQAAVTWAPRLDCCTAAAALRAVQGSGLCLSQLEPLDPGWDREDATGGGEPHFLLRFEESADGRSLAAALFGAGTSGLRVGAPLRGDWAVRLASCGDVHCVEGHCVPANAPPPGLTLVLDLDATLVDHSPHLHAELLTIHYLGKAGVSEEDVWVRPGIRGFLALLAPHFRMKVVTKSYSRRARAILQKLDPERRHILRGCPAMRTDISRVEQRIGLSPEDRLQRLQQAAEELEASMEGVVFVPQHICQFAGRPCTYDGLRSTKKTLRMLFDGQPAENYRRFVLILDDHVSEWEETGNVVSMLPFQHDLDDPPGYVA